METNIDDLIQRDQANMATPYYGGEDSVNFKGVKPEFMDKFGAMAKDYYNQTGKRLKVNDAWRSQETQAKAYQDWQMGLKKAPAVAKPGHSEHEKGLAMDIDEAQVNELDKRGLLKSYGFYRPMMAQGKGKVYEPWHIQMVPSEKPGLFGVAQAHAEGGAGPSIDQLIAQDKKNMLMTGGKSIDQIIAEDQARGQGQDQEAPALAVIPNQEDENQGMFERASKVLNLDIREQGKWLGENIPGFKKASELTEAIAHTPGSELLMPMAAPIKEFNALAAREAPGMLGRWARNKMGSLLKPSTTLEESARTGIIESAVKGGYAPTVQGVYKMKNDWEAIGNKIGDAVKGEQAANPDKVVDTNKVLKALNGVWERFSPKAAEMGYTQDEIRRQIMDWGENYLREKGPVMTLEEAQASKVALHGEANATYRNMNQVVSNRKYISSLERAMQMAVADQGLRPELETLVPGIKELNQQWGRLAELNKPLQKAEARFANQGSKDLWNMGVGGVLGEMLGGPMGAGVGAGAAKLMSIASRSPAFQGRLISLYEAMDQAQTVAQLRNVWSQVPDVAKPLAAPVMVKSLSGLSPAQREFDRKNYDKLFDETLEHLDYSKEGSGTR